MSGNALCIGGVSWDELVVVDALPSVGGLVHATARTGAVGGVARSAIALANMGYQVTVSSLEGAGPSSAWAREELEAAGVHCCFATVDNDLTSTVLLTAQERTIIAPPRVPATQAPAVDASRFNVVLCATSDVETFLHALATARSGTVSSYDGGVHLTGPRAHAARSAAIVTGKPSFFAGLTADPRGASAAEAGARQLLEGAAVTVAITNGPEPVRLFTADAVHEVVPPVVPVVDPCGAGDVFHAILAGLVARGVSPLTAAREAVEAASAHCAVLGNYNLSR